MFTLYMTVMVTIIAVCAVGLVVKAVSYAALLFNLRREERRLAKEAAVKAAQKAAEARKKAQAAKQQPKRRPGRPRKDPNAPPKPRQSRKTGTITLTPEQFEALVKALNTTSPATQKGA